MFVYNLNLYICIVSKINPFQINGDEEQDRAKGKTIVFK